MQQQPMVNLLKTLGEPKDGRPWRDYANDGISAADAPALIRLIQSEEFSDLDDEEDDAWWVPLHAWRALKQVMPAGLEALIASFNLLAEDEWATEEIPIVVAAAKDKAIQPLTAFLRSADQDELARMLASDCLCALGTTHTALRGKVIQALTDCLEQVTVKEAAIGGTLVFQLINLSAAEAINTIRRAFAEGRVDMSQCGDLEDVEMALGLRAERSTPRPDYHGNAAQSKKSKAADEDDEHDDTPRIVPLIRTEPKIGRNDPCPCGSGKKYKKCCMA